MITTLTLNPAIDKTVSIPSFKYGGMNRIQASRSDIAGKGFNVAKGLANLGNRTVAVGFLYEKDALEAKSSLEKEGINVDCIICPGSIRTNIKLFDMEKQVVTEINEKGNQVNQEFLNQIIEKLIFYSKQSEILVLTGSLPPGCPDDFYKVVIEKCKPFTKIFLDAEGAKFEEGIKAIPTMIKPNKYELETYLGHSLKSLKEIKEAAISFIEKGIQIVSVSLGGEGALITDGRETFFSPPIKNIEVKGTVGAGDSMVAGLCAAFIKGLSLKECFRYSVASATACVIQDGTLTVTKCLLDQMLDKVEIEVI